MFDFLNDQAAGATVRCRQVANSAWECASQTGYDPEVLQTLGGLGVILLVSALVLAYALRPIQER